MDSTETPVLESDGKDGLTEGDTKLKVGDKIDHDGVYYKDKCNAW